MSVRLSEFERKKLEELIIAPSEQFSFPAWDADKVAITERLAKKDPPLSGILRSGDTFYVFLRCQGLNIAVARNSCCFTACRISDFLKKRFERYCARKGRPSFYNYSEASNANFFTSPKIAGALSEWLDKLENFLQDRDYLPKLKEGERVTPQPRPKYGSVRDLILKLEAEVAGLRKAVERLAPCNSKPEATPIFK